MRRVLAPVEVELATNAGSPVHGRLVDLSVLGLRMEAPGRLPMGTSCRIRLRVEESPAGIEARGTVVRTEDGSLALRFDELPYESYELLRTLLLRCTDDPSALDDELSDRMGFLSEGA